MTTLFGLSGSLRKDSLNTKLLHAAAALVPSGVTLEIGSIRDVPLYDGDVEAEHGVPASVAALKGRIAAADALLLVTPEYNASIPGVFKNTIDWLSRPSADIARVFGGRPVALMGASPGRFGTLLSQTAWLQVVRTLGMRPCFDANVYVGGADKVFDERGALTDERVRAQVKKLLLALASAAGTGA